MNPQDPLAALHPLRQPDPINWWPLAPGWWLLIVLLLLAISAVAFLLLRRYRRNAYRRKALSQLEQLRQAHLQHQDDAVYLAGTNALLKSVALRAYPRRDVAACSGDAWLDFLNGSCSKAGRFPAGFVTAAYRKQCPAIDMEQLYESAVYWIKRHEATA